MKKFAITIAIIFSTFAAQAKDIKCKIIDPNSGFIGVIAFSLNESKKTFKLFALDGTNQILADENYGIIYQFKNKEFKYNKNEESSIIFNHHVYVYVLRTRSQTNSSNQCKW